VVVGLPSTGSVTSTPPFLSRMWRTPISRRSAGHTFGILRRQALVTAGPPTSGETEGNVAEQRERITRSACRPATEVLSQLHGNPARPTGGSRRLGVAELLWEQA
jgi:hypothetical protein